MPDEDVTLEIPDSPPGEPSVEPEKKDTPAPIALTGEQLRDIVRESTSSAISALTPKTPPKTLDVDAPSGPSPAELQTKIDSIDSEIDLAAESGDRSKVRALTRQRDELRDQKFDIERVQPLRSQGSQAINDLVLNQIATDPELGEIFSTYREEVMNALSVGIRQGQALRLDWVKEATRMVAGRHLKEITDRDYEARTRKAKEGSPTPLPGSSNGRSLKTPDTNKLPETIREQFGDRADEAFRFKSGKGHTPDSFARVMGFKDRNEWFAKDRELTENRTLGLDK